MSLLNDFEHLKVRLEDIKLATNNFGDDPIGIGGFGKVYKGELSLPTGRIMVAFKRLDRRYGQGDIEFWKEMMMLSQWRHENLVCLLHFCNEDAERILVYEYAARGSLDRYLGDTSLSWTQRLKICLGAAHGLNYLHDPMKTQQRVLHRDIKSSNILLDDKWTAKVSDFGLSKLGPANQEHTYLVSNVVGTPGYCDPLYWEVGFLSKESDVYSFGVVLFEVMCGRYCFEHRNGDLHILVPLWKKCYFEDRLGDIICQHVKEQIDSDSLVTFSRIAYQCLEKNREDRPTIAEVIKKLEIALDQQEILENIDFEEITQIANLAATPLIYGSPNQLMALVSKGVLLNDNKTWILINKKGERQELISVKEHMFMYPSHDPWRQQKHVNGSRFQFVPCFSVNSEIQIDVSTRFLSPHVIYIVNLVYKHDESYQGKHAHLTNVSGYPTDHEHVPFKYKLDGETKCSNSCVARKEHGWLITELYQFTSTQKEHEFRIQFVSQSQCPRLNDRFVLEGIEFRPVKCEKDENLEDESNMDMQMQIEELEIDWEEKLPSDWTRIISWSKDKWKWNTKKELYYLLRKGFFIDKRCKYIQWFSISKNSKKRLMLPACAVLLKEPILMSLCGRRTWILKTDPNSRFGTVAESCKMKSFAIDCTIESNKLSHETTYACYLVYKLPKEHSEFEGIVQLDCHQSSGRQLIYLVTPPHTPVIRPDHVDQESDHSHLPSLTRKIKGHPKIRKDGWMEIQLSHFSDNHHAISYRLSSYDHWNFTGLLVQGIEFRPAKVTF